MKISHFLSAAVLGLSSVAVNAAVIDFNIAAPTAGTISYDGAGGALLGFAIEVDSVAGIDTPANSGELGVLTCDECGEQMHFSKAGHIPPCPKCKKGHFHRMFCS